MPPLTIGIFNYKCDCCYDLYVIRPAALSSSHPKEEEKKPVKPTVFHGERAGLKRSKV
jgi:hypothetical protein